MIRVHVRSTDEILSHRCQVTRRSLVRLDTMLFPTFQFAVFFAVVFTIAWSLARRTTAWKLFLLAASYGFYASWNWRFLPLLVGLPLANQLCAIVIARRPRFARVAVTVALALDLGTLVAFKYLGFLSAACTTALHLAGLHIALPMVQWVLPLGVSFITFQALSYVVDVYRGTMKPASTLDVAMYVAFFPHVVAGPIVRAAEFVPQVGAPPDASRIEAARALALVTGGLFKKVVLASYLASSIVDGVFAEPERHGALETLLAIYGYAVQIYCDFSGYTDIAIGCALLLGVRFPQNFDSPYAADSLQDFWHRWHITLSRWLRDYLYVALGGNRRGRALTYRNLFLTMLLGGLWHGAAWTFVVWGALHGAGLACERFVREKRSRASRSESRGLGRVVRVALTFHFVCVGWVFFRADSVTTAFTVFRQLFVRHAASSVTPGVLAAIGVGLAMQFVPAATWDSLRMQLSRRHPIVQGTAFGLSLFVIDLLGPSGVAPFIYFQF